jgi:hypothetical protein
VVSFTLRPLYPHRKIPQYPLIMRLEAEGCVGPRIGLEDVERRKILPITRLER